MTVRVIAAFRPTCDLLLCSTPTSELQFWPKLVCRSGGSCSEQAKQGRGAVVDLSLSATVLQGCSTLPNAATVLCHTMSWAVYHAVYYKAFSIVTSAALQGLQHSNKCNNTHVLHGVWLALCCVFSLCAASLCANDFDHIQTYCWFFAPFQTETQCVKQMTLLSCHDRPVNQCVHPLQFEFVVPVQ